MRGLHARKLQEGIIRQIQNHRQVVMVLHLASALTFVKIDKALMDFTLVHIENSV